LTTEGFIKRAREVHGNKYDYSKTIYQGKRKKVIITCPIHGDFEQWPKNHYNGQGCPKCGKKYAQEYRKGNYKHFVGVSIERFGDNYEFPNIEEEYENSHSVITIKCKKCGTVFKKIACDHITSPNGGCPKCYPYISNGEQEIGDYIRSILPDTEITKDRRILNGKELDIFIPSMNIAFEYNGLYWHGENNGKAKNYHLTKTEMCKNKNINLIHIFEDEYIEHKDIVLNKIAHLLKQQINLPKIMGRKCIAKEIGFKESSDFLNKYHIQGNSSSTVYLGAYFNDMLIAVMSFKEEVKESGKWELTRFASDYHYICQGVGGKLFKYFIKKYNPDEIKSFADRRWTINEENNLYTKLGFKFKKYTHPDYKYVINGRREHKFGFRKQTLHKKYGFPLDMTETQMIGELGLNKIWDCGLIKYVWKNSIFEI
jgi:hypothetical protein